MRNKIEFNEIISYVGSFLLGFSLTWIFGFWKGLTLAIGLIMMFHYSRWGKK